MLRFIEIAEHYQPAVNPFSLAPRRPR